MSDTNNQQSFKHKLASGVSYTALSKYSGIIIGIIISSILSRQLTPRDYGVVAIAGIAIGLFGLFSDMGIGPAIIQKRELTRDELSGIFSFSFYLALSLGLMVFLTAPLVGHFYDNPDVVPICRLLSISLFFSTINCVPNGLLVKERRFRFIAVRTIVVQSILGILSVIAVFLGAGIYALIINPVVGGIISFFVNYQQNPLPFHFRFPFSPLRKIASFSLFQFSFNFVNYFTRNLDTLLIGKYMSMGKLGYYEKSYRLMMYPLSTLTGVVSPVLHPIMAEYQDNLKEQCEKYLKLIKMLAIIGFPFTPLMFFCGNDLIMTLYGDQWGASVPIFKILSLTIYLQIMSSTIGGILQSTNNTKKLFFTGNINTVINVIGLLIGLFVFKSLVGVAWMMVLTFHIGLWNFWYIMHKVFNESFKRFLNHITPGIIEVIVCSVMLFSTSLIFHHLFDVPTIPQRIIIIAFNTLITITIVAITLQKTGTINILNYLSKFKTKIVSVFRK